MATFFFFLTTCSLIENINSNLLIIEWEGNFMDINLINFVGFFIIYLFIGFVFFYFSLFKKPGANIVGTICLILVFFSLAIGFISAIYRGILNLFMLVMGFWFAYIITKMNYDDKQKEERRKISQQRQYKQKLTRKHLEKKTE